MNGTRQNTIIIDFEYLRSIEPVLPLNGLDAAFGWREKHVWF